MNLEPSWTICKQTWGIFWAGLSLVHMNELSAISFAPTSDLSNSIINSHSVSFGRRFLWTSCPSFRAHEKRHIASKQARFKIYQGFILDLSCNMGGSRLPAALFIYTVCRSFCSLKYLLPKVGTQQSYSTKWTWTPLYSIVRVFANARTMGSRWEGGNRPVSRVLFASARHEEPPENSVFPGGFGKKRFFWYNVTLLKPPVSQTWGYSCWKLRIVIILTVLIRIVLFNITCWNLKLISVFPIFHYTLKHYVRWQVFHNQQSFPWSDVRPIRSWLF